jgi:nitrogen fixation protein NifU and related proteins
MAMNPYGEVITEHFRHPRNYGSLEKPDVRREDVNPFCGDRIRIDLSIAEDGTVKAARFEGDLCMIGKAAGSLLTEMIQGTNVADVEALPDQRILDALHAEIRPARLACALLPLRVLQAGVAEYRRSRATL